MKNTILVITSIAAADHPILKQLAEGCLVHQVPLIVIGDSKSPAEFQLDGCDFYSVSRQQKLDFKMATLLPLKHYSRKNLGYLLAMAAGAEVIIETDDDNLPLPAFWQPRVKTAEAHVFRNAGWVNVYRYFSDEQIWPRGFSLLHLKNSQPLIKTLESVECSIQQGLADENPDVDAIYRLTCRLPVTFNKAPNIALGGGSVCPFNSQNTTWFDEAFPLLYLPSYCSFRMTDIWRSFVAQRIAFSCGWHLLFHQSTVTQDRNDHNLMVDFSDEIKGYLHNEEIVRELKELKLVEGPSHIADNMRRCYQLLINMKLIGASELELLEAWICDISSLTDRKILSGGGLV